MHTIAWFSKFSSHSKNASDLLTCFDIILETEHALTEIKHKKWQSFIFSVRGNQALISGNNCETCSQKCEFQVCDKIYSYYAI